MLKLVLRRLLIAVPLLVAVSFALFVLMRLVPGDAAATIAGDRATPRVLEQVRARLGIDRPLHEQYFSWLGKAVRGDLGTSLFNSQPVARSIKDRLPATLSLTAAGMTVAIVLGVTAGMVAAQRAGSVADRLITATASLGLAVPTFWLGLLLIVTFTFRLEWLPPTGYSRFGDGVGDWLRSITMPAIALGVPAASVLARQTRSALLDVMQRDFIRAARARGASRTSVMLKHGLKNAAAPIATVLALELISMLGGSVIIEALFNIAGLGDLTIGAVQERDLPVIQGVVMVVAIFVVLANLAVDIVYGYVNPRGRQG